MKKLVILFIVATLGCYKEIPIKTIAVQKSVYTRSTVSGGFGYFAQFSINEPLNTAIIFTISFKTDTSRLSQKYFFTDTLKPGSVSIDKFTGIFEYRTYVNSAINIKMEKLECSNSAYKFTY